MTRSDYGAGVLPGIERSLYPFSSNYFACGAHRLHYLDEGPKDGPPLVMLHGNPTWSFYYREVVKALRDQYRCIVPDHIGCGLSDKPPDAAYDYTLEQRVADVTALLEHLGVHENITLIVHDWGGMIGSLYAVRNPERIARLVVLNTSAFHLPPSKPFPWPLWLARTPLGALMVRGFNAFSATATRVCTVKPLTPEVRRAYRAPYDSWENRIATLRFVQDIPLRKRDPSYDAVSEAQANIGQFADKPVLICWGMRDWVFDRHFLALWEEALPTASVHRFEDAGHYVLEDAGDRIVALVRGFLGESERSANATSSVDLTSKQV